MKSLRSAYFPEFKGGAKLLLWGDRTAIHQLSEVLRKASFSLVSTRLSDICEPVDGKPILLIEVNPLSGLREISNRFEWGLDPETLNNFADKLDVLADSVAEGHQYLECGVIGEITVMVSHNEYPVEMYPARDPAATGKSG